jgi:RNA recognition motif-containing protein
MIAMSNCRNSILVKGQLLMPVRLFVGNLSPETTDNELLELFSRVGDVESCRLSTDERTGRSKGFGFIEMNSKEGADAAEEKLNGHDLHGRPLKVKRRGQSRYIAGYPISSTPNATPPEVES